MALLGHTIERVAAWGGWERVAAWGEEVGIQHLHYGHAVRIPVSGYVEGG
jgi:hypothetical protein